MNIKLFKSLTHKRQEFTCIHTSQNSDYFTATHYPHTSTFSHDFKQHNHHSHNFEHAYLNINITKHISSLLCTSKNTQSKVQWELLTGTYKGGTILVFGMNILNLKGCLGKGIKRKETHTLIDVQTLKFLPKPSSKTTSNSQKFSPPTSQKSPLP